jgi:flagellar biosynthesis chaperone FliJ
LDGAQAISDGLKRGEQTAESIKAQEGLQKAMEQMNQQEMEPLDRVQDLEGQQEVSVEAESAQQSQSFVEQVEEQRQKQKQKQGQDLGGSNNGR